ncbi:21527_t:CDS:2, partial [Racocetra persica]
DNAKDDTEDDAKNDAKDDAKDDTEDNNDQQSNDQQDDEQSDDQLNNDQLKDTNDTANEKTSESENRSEKKFTKGDHIYEFFQRVFVNDSWSCASPIEKPYYSAGIFPVVCFLCGNKNITTPVKENIHCVLGVVESLYQKKCYKWRPGTNKKGKQHRTE